VLLSYSTAEWRAVRCSFDSCVTEELLRTTLRKRLTKCVSYETKWPTVSTIHPGEALGYAESAEELREAAHLIALRETYQRKMSGRLPSDG
jgi:hypothetical protein